jgi:hypothetical protein
LPIKWPFSVSSASSVVIKNCDALKIRFRSREGFVGLP